MEAFLIHYWHTSLKFSSEIGRKKGHIHSNASGCHQSQCFGGERTGLVVRASDSGSGDPGSILGRVGVLFP